MKKCFKVTAKCGHVGRDKFYKGEFYVKAQSASEAASKVRNYPRVKHNHADAILGVQEIKHEDYINGRKAIENEIYFHCNSRHMQALYWDEISKNIYEETGNKSGFRTQPKVENNPVRKVNNQVVRNYKKYCMFRKSSKYDLAEAY